MEAIVVGSCNPTTLKLNQSISIDSESKLPINATLFAACQAGVTGGPGMYGAKGGFGGYTTIITY